MRFTYDGYDALLKLIKQKGYTITDYHNYIHNEKCVILRHDIDYDLNRVLKIAQIEANNNVKSTYFVLVTSQFYNPFSVEAQTVFNDIIEYGHEIGLHFDEMRYIENSDLWDEKKLVDYIQKECNILETILGNSIRVVSMHRPSKQTLNSNLHIEGIVNSYSKKFFNDFKYVSDSRMYWRENVEDIIKSNDYSKIHILTHPFWYNEKEESIKKKIEGFIHSGNKDRALLLEKNITNLKGILYGENTL